MTTLPARVSNRFVRTVYALRYRYFDNFIFIHINKTGGSSIEKALKLPFEHLTALEKIEEVGREKWEQKYTFAVVRNPWDKVVSHYHYRVQTNQTDLATKPVEFRDWVRLAYAKNDPMYYDNPKMFMPQFDWIADQDGQILVDYVCRLEDIDEDFRAVCCRIGKTVRLPHVKTSERGQYREYYDQETIEIVANCFERDIDSFGYRY